MKNIICLLIVLAAFCFPNAILGQIVSTHNELISSELRKYKLNTELEIELNTGFSVKGKLFAINKDNFEITDNKNSVKSFLFSDVKQIKKAKRNLFLSIINNVGQAVLFVPTLVVYLVYCSTHNCA